MPTFPNTGVVLPTLDGSLNTWGEELNNAFITYESFWAPNGILPITKGGTGSSTASDARSALGTGTIATQDASSVSAGTISTSGTFGIKTASPTADCEVNGQLKAVNGTFLSSFSGASATLGAVDFGSSLQVNTSLKTPTFIVDSSGNKLIKHTTLKNTSDKTISAGTNVYDVVWDAEDVDDLSAWTSGSSFTLPAGKYFIHCCFQLIFSVNDSSGHNFYLYNSTDNVNVGMDNERFDSNYGSDVKMNGFTVIKITSSKTFKIQLFQYSSGSVTLKAISAAFPPRLTIVKVE